MMIRKNVIVAVLITFCLGIALFRILPTRSANTAYDPWLDVNDDGKVDMRDIGLVCSGFGEYDINSINKTTLLYNVNATFTTLLSRIDNLNSSLAELQSEVDGLNATNLMPLINSLNNSLIGLRSDVTQLQYKLNDLNNTLSSRISSLETQVATISATIAGMNSTITDLQNANADLNSRVNDLEGNFSLLLSRVNALEANYSSTIPYKSTYTYGSAATSDAYNWGDMPAMSVTLTVNRTSNLMILFSTEAYCSVGPAESTYIYIQAMVNSSYANPNWVILTPNVQVTGFSFLPSHSHYLSTGAYSYIFNMPSITPGSYTIKIQWRVSYSSPQGTGYVGYRTLTVIALPT